MVLYTKPYLKLIYYEKQYNSEEGEILKGLLKEAAQIHKYFRREVYCCAFGRECHNWPALL